MGKTTLSSQVRDRRVLSTDEFRNLPWEAVPEKVIQELSNERSFVVEGVQVARALRKGLTVDAVVYLSVSKIPSRMPRQIAMAKAVHTILTDWRKTNPATPVFAESA